MISRVLPNIARHPLIGIVVIVGTIARFRRGRRFLIIHSFNFGRRLRFPVLLIRFVFVFSYYGSPDCVYGYYAYLY